MPVITYTNSLLANHSQRKAFGIVVSAVNSCAYLPGSNLVNSFNFFPLFLTSEGTYMKIFK